MSALDVLLPARAVFHPVVDLGSGAVVAVEAHAGPTADPSAGPLPDPAADLRPDPYAAPPAPAGRPDPAAHDVRRAVDAAGAAAELGTRLPLLVGLRAETLAAGEHVLSALHRGLGSAGRRPNEIILCATGGFPPGIRPAVAAALGGLRRAGYLVGLAGLGAAHAPLDLLADVAPYLLKLDADLARRTPGEPRRSALAGSLMDLAHRLETHVLAPGLETQDQVLHLRGLGARLAQGPVLAGPEWRPGMPVSVPVAAREEPAARLPYASLGPRVSEFTLPAITLPHTATADEVLEALNAESGVTSIVLVDERQRPYATVDRTRFLLRLSGPYGHALHAARPAARLADRPRPVPRTVPAVAALRAAGREDERVYDDLVVVDEVGRCLGIVRVADLIRGLSP
ncbi:EAL domain-containing protein [Actinomadura sp. WAC 06369]|uniref:EAL domain-containing protein n=1 Tax=Actinomadura sp. WAC 06369 TaxID=2203193 RepID=UPI000F7A9A79|nr:EAL domain-containing protein [Actinomadura sp. WAC 06369]RSN70794.1 diguanylate phosphodiesterase [Actinomadura sp. WAC 06369]